MRNLAAFSCGRNGRRELHAREIAFLKYISCRMLYISLNKEIKLRHF